MTLYYAETVGPTGRWSPRTTPTRPDTVTKGGHLRERGLNGLGPRIRNIHRVDPQHEALTLDQLAAIYGSEATEAVSAPAGEDAA